MELNLAVLWRRNHPAFDPEILYAATGIEASGIVIPVVVFEGHKSLFPL